MKKFMLIFVAIAFISRVKAQNLQTFIYKDPAFKMEYPGSWKVSQDEFGKNKMITFESPKTDEKERRGDAMLALTVQPLEKGITTLDGLMKTQLGALKKEMGVKTFLENKRVEGKQILVFNMQGGDKVLKTKMVLWVHKGLMYNFMYASKIHFYDTYIKAAENIIQSFTYL
ncbi:MAG: hypothetical protein IT257_05775 [Chitinophagaceae bacterium]|nr:hypothetical protein [Chitinophagaceae bacterium]